MDPVYCLELVLKKIQENIQLFEANESLNPLCNTLLKLGRLAMEKPLSLTVMKNILISLHELHTKNIVPDSIYKSFLKEVNEFYKSKNLCPYYRLEILQCFVPAMEVEVLCLLKLCSNVLSISQLSIIKSAVEDSVLLQLFQNKPTVFNRIFKILRSAFIASEGNPVIAYLSYCLFNSIRKRYNCSFLPKDLHHLETLFQLPYEFLSEAEQDFFVRKLISFCDESLKFSICTKDEMLFYAAVFPNCYHKMLIMCSEKSSEHVFKFLKSLSFSEGNDKSDWLLNMNLAQNDCFWKAIED